MKRKLTKTESDRHHFVDGERIEGTHSRITGNVFNISGDVSGISGDVSGIYGDVSGIYGSITGICGNLDDCDLSSEDRKKRININDLLTIKEKRQKHEPNERGRG